VRPPPGPGPSAHSQNSNFRRRSLSFDSVHACGIHAQGACRIYFLAHDAGEACLHRSRGTAQRYPFCVVYNDDKWNLEKRFSDFAELDKQLDEIYKGDSSVQVCPLPSSCLKLHQLAANFLQVVVLT
jgi:hypothetical protein